MNTILPSLRKTRLAMKNKFTSTLQKVAINDVSKCDIEGEGKRLQLAMR